MTTQTPLGPSTKFNLTGRDFEVPAMSFYLQRKCWPAIEVLLSDRAIRDEAGNVVIDQETGLPKLKPWPQSLSDAFEVGHAACQLIVTAQGGDPNSGEVEALERSVSGADMFKLQGIAYEILTASGLLRGTGEARPGATGESPSGETSTS
jgi:hypothetical protein